MSVQLFVSYYLVNPLSYQFPHVIECYRQLAMEALAVGSGNQPAFMCLVVSLDVHHKCSVSPFYPEGSPWQAFQIGFRLLCLLAFVFGWFVAWFAMWVYVVLNVYHLLLLGCWMS